MHTIHFPNNSVNSLLLNPASSCLSHFFMTNFSHISGLNVFKTDLHKPTHSLKKNSNNKTHSCTTDTALNHINGDTIRRLTHENQPVDNFSRKCTQDPIACILNHISDASYKLSSELMISIPWRQQQDVEEASHSQFLHIKDNRKMFHKKFAFLIKER